MPINELTLTNLENFIKEKLSIILFHIFGCSRKYFIQGNFLIDIIHLTCFPNKLSIISKDLLDHEQPNQLLRPLYQLGMRSSSGENLLKSVFLDDKLYNLVYDRDLIALWLI